MTQIQNFKMYINGEWVNSSSGKKIKTLNPETNEVWATVPEANEEDVNKAVQAAQKMKDMHGYEKHKYLIEVVSIEQRQVAKHHNGVHDWHRVTVPTKTLDQPCI